MLKISADVRKLFVSGGVNRIGPLEKLLARTFRSQNYRVASLFEALGKMGEQAVITIQLKRHLWHKHKIDVVPCQRRSRCDVSRLSAHHFNQSDSVGSALRLSVSRGDYFGCFSHGWDVCRRGWFVRRCS